MELVSVIDADPELGGALSREEHAAARAEARPALLRLPKGPWHLDSDWTEHPRHLGLLLVEGMLARDVVLGNRMGVELLGPGDVLRPWVRLGRHTSISLEENFTVTEPSALAVL